MTRLHIPIVKECQRCGGDHADMTFNELDSPIGVNDLDMPYRWWASCPTTGEPILIRQCAQWEEEYASTKESPRYISREEYQTDEDIVNAALGAFSNGAVSG